jgi:hypothetical protein
MATLLVLRKKVGSLLLGGRGRLTSAVHRRKAIELISEAHTAGAGLVSACSEIGICLRTLKRWRKALIGDGAGHDQPGVGANRRRPGSIHQDRKTDPNQLRLWWLLERQH